MTIGDWILAALISTLGLSFFLSIPSFVQMRKLGFKNYFKTIKLLHLLNKNLSICYSVESAWSYNYRYTDGRVKTHSGISTTYYLPYYISDEKVFIVHFNGGEYSTVLIDESDYDGESWKMKRIELRLFTCLILSLLNDKLKAKIKSLSSSSTKVSDINNLNDLINSQIKVIRRDYKLKSILN